MRPFKFFLTVILCLSFIPYGQASIKNAYLVCEDVSLESVRSCKKEVLDYYDFFFNDAPGSIGRTQMLHRFSAMMDGYFTQMIDFSCQLDTPQVYLNNKKCQSDIVQMSWLPAEVTQTTVKHLNLFSGAITEIIAPGPTIDLTMEECMEHYIYAINGKCVTGTTSKVDVIIIIEADIGTVWGDPIDVGDPIVVPEGGGGGPGAGGRSVPTLDNENKYGNAKFDFSITPNPLYNAQDLKVEFTTAAVFEEKAMIEIYDGTGRLIQQQTINGILSENNYTEHLSTETLSAGLYFVTITIGKERRTERLVKL